MSPAVRQGRAGRRRRRDSDRLRWQAGVATLAGSKPRRWHQCIDSGAPCLAGPAQQLADVGRAAGQGQGFEHSSAWVKTDRVTGAKPSQSSGKAHRRYETRSVLGSHALLSLLDVICTSGEDRQQQRYDRKEEAVDEQIRVVQVPEIHQDD